MNIIYAGYGVHDSTANATFPVSQAYNGGERVFLANNNWVGDPAYGTVKYLYILWQDDQGNLVSGVVREQDPQGITLP